MAWTTLPVEYGEEPAAFKVELLMTERDGVLYGAGRCWVRIGHAPAMKAIAVRAGKERRITTLEHGMMWLVQHGLPRVTAEELVQAADQQPEPRDPPAA